MDDYQKMRQHLHALDSFEPFISDLELVKKSLNGSNSFCKVVNYLSYFYLLEYFSNLSFSFTDSNGSYEDVLKSTAFAYA